MKHAIVFSAGYMRGLAVHILYDGEVPHADLARAAAEVAAKAGAPFSENPSETALLKLRYVGVESLPLKAPPTPFYLVVQFRDGRGEVLAKRGDADLGAIERFKSGRITADYDYGNTWRFVQRVDRVAAKCGVMRNIRFYKTYAGAHMRAELAEPLSHEEKLTLRVEMLDDFERLEHDRFLASSGYAALADCLFNEKYFISEKGFILYREEPLLITTAELDVSADYEDELLVVKSGKVTFKRPMEPFTAARVLSKLEAELKRKADEEWERVERIKKVAGDDVEHPVASILAENPLKATVFTAYKRAAGKLAASLVLASEVVEKDGTVYIVVPPLFAPLAGVLIGRGGANVEVAQLLLGKRVKIVAPKPEKTPSSDELAQLRRKLEEVMLRALK